MIPALQGCLGSETGPETMCCVPPTKQPGADTGILTHIRDGQQALGIWARERTNQVDEAMGGELQSSGGNSWVRPLDAGFFVATVVGTIAQQLPSMLTQRMFPKPHTSLV
jgi:hypothetical protein